MNHFLLIGEKKDYRTELYSNSLKQKTTPYKLISWEKAIKGKLPNIKSNEVIIKLLSPWKDKELVKKWQFPYTINDPEIFSHSSRNFSNSLNLIDQNLNNSYESIQYINSPDSIWLARDKYEMSKKFIENNIPHPKVFFDVKSYKDLEAKLRDYPDIILKLRTGSLGKRIAVVKRNDDSTIQCHSNWNGTNSYTKDSTWSAFNKIDNIEKFIDKILDYSMLVQERIKLSNTKNGIFDVRMLTIYDTVPFFYGRVNEDFVTNIACGGVEMAGQEIIEKVPYKMLDSAVNASIKASKALGLKSAGNDIIFNEDYSEYYVLESNAFPGIQGALNQGFDPYGYEIAMIPQSDETNTLIKKKLIRSVQ